MIAINVISISTNVRNADDSLNRIAAEGLQDLKIAPKQEKFSLMDIFDSDNGDNRFLAKEDNRSFKVLIDEELSLVSTNVDDKNIIEDDTAYALALQALEDNNGYGFVDEYRYMVIKEADYYKIIFLDYSFEKQSEVNFMVVSLGIFILSIILVAILVRIFMKPVMKPIREAYCKQKQFITDASHELKTPLTVIATDIQLIEMEKGSSNWTKSIINQVERLKALSNDLVTLSRMEEENIQLQMSEVNLSEIVNDVVMGFEPAIKAGGKRFIGKIEEAVTVIGNYDALEKVMSVLMHNALKYSNQNGMIQVDLYKKGKNVQLSVTNSTDHIEKGNHDEYFRRFYRGDKSRNSNSGGFGIGLAVAKSTIEEHKGKIEAKSHDGRSLTILITL
jgi:signal transduction histidine kinase